MKKIAFFDTKKYDIESFDRNNSKFEIIYYEDKLNKKTVVLANGCDAVCAFVNDDINKEVIDLLYSFGIKVLLLRCAGYNNVDIKYAYNKIHILRVPAYSPNAVAEHAMALLLCLNRKIHKAYLRTRDFNFNIAGFTGFDLAGKTVGVIGTGKIESTYAYTIKNKGTFTLTGATIANTSTSTTTKTNAVINEHRWNFLHIIANLQICFRCICFFA